MTQSVGRAASRGRRGRARLRSADDRRAVRRHSRPRPHSRARLVRAAPGEPSFFPNATEVVWTLADDRSLYIEEDPRRAGGALITVFVDDLDTIISEVGSRGLEPAERETYSNGVRKATYRDDDGNEIGFGGAPRND